MSFRNCIPLVKETFDCQEKANFLFSISWSVKHFSKIFVGSSMGENIPNSSPTDFIRTPSSQPMSCKLEDFYHPCFSGFVSDNAEVRARLVIIQASRVLSATTLMVLCDTHCNNITSFVTTFLSSHYYTKA